MRKDHLNLIVKGEMMPNFAFSKELLEESFFFSKLTKRKPNTFIFPNLSATNDACKLPQYLGTAEALGLMLVEINKSDHVLQMDNSVREIVNMVTLASVEDQTRNSNRTEQ